MSEIFDVTIPPVFFDRCTETKEQQVWTDDRGFVYAVMWSDQHSKPLAACVHVPWGASTSDIWHRRTPQPAYIKN